MADMFADTLYSEIHRCANLMHRGQHQKPEQGSTQRGQGRLLSLLLEEDGIAQKEIVRMMDIRPSSAGELVTKLEQNGYVERKFNENDKRITNVFLTKAGREKAQELVQHKDESLDGLFTVLSLSEREQLVALMKKLNESLSEKFEKGADAAGTQGGGAQARSHTRRNNDILD